MIKLREGDVLAMATGEIMEVGEIIEAKGLITVWSWHMSPHDPQFHVASLDHMSVIRALNSRKICLI